MSEIQPFDVDGAQALSVAARGPTHDWHEPRGRYHDAATQHFATFQVTAIGGERPEHRGVPPASISRLILSSAAFLPGCDALEILYLAAPRPSGFAELQMFITAKSCLEQAGSRLAAAAATAAARALPADYVSTPVSRHSVDDASSRGGQVFELRRNEEVTYPTWDYIPADYYYYLNDRPGDGTGWAALWRALARVTEPVAISLLFKQTDLDPQERHVVGAITTDLALLAVTRQDHDILGYPTTYPGCENAAIALGAWQERLRALTRPLLGRVAVRGQYGTAMAVATALASAIAQDADSARVSPPMVVDTPLTPEDQLAAHVGFDWLEIDPWGGSPIWSEPNAPRSLRRFAYLYGLDEAAGLAVLPVADEQGVPGFPRAQRIAGRRAASITQPREDSVRVGELTSQGKAVAPAWLPLSAINRHVLVVGASGSGKTTTVLSLLASLWRDHRIPFIAIEPSKSEYRSLLSVPGVRDDLRIVCLGRDDVAPMRLNPLAPPEGVRMEVQANAVLAALKAALPLTPPLPQLLEDSIERAYQRAGWDYDTTAADGLAPPSLRTVMLCFTEVFEDAGYVGEARNVASAMQTRLRSLVRGSKGRMLDTVESTDFSDLMTGPVVIELDEVADAEDKAVMASFLLDRLRADARRKGSSGGRLRHVTVIEEAHRLLARLTPSSGNEGDNSRAAAVESFCNAIAELRSVGEGFILSSQSPSRLAEAAVDNCGTRILHRTESARDRDIVLADLDANELEREATARLGVGEAIARWPQLDEPEFIQVQPADGVDSGQQVAVESVKQHMLPEATEVRRLLPYSLCTRAVCVDGCDAQVRATGEAIAMDLKTSAASAWEDHHGKATALAPIAAELRREAGGDLQKAYCGAAHLAAFGIALHVRRAVDIRSQLQQALAGGER